MATKNETNSQRGSCQPKPSAATRIALLSTAALPWYAMFSGIYGLYFYILLLAGAVGGIISETFAIMPFAIALLLVIPLSALLLLALPATTLWAACGRRLHPAARRLAVAGCIATMSLALLYALIIIASGVTSIIQGDADKVRGMLLYFSQALILVAGGCAAWKSWRWLRKDRHHGAEKTQSR